MRSLDILKRLAKRAVDRERQALQAINADIAATESEIAALQQAIDREASAPLDFMKTGTTLAAFIRAKRQRTHDLKTRLLQLQHDHDAQLERLREERVEQKRYELLAERRARQAALARAAKEQKAIDEMVAIKAGRPPDGGRPS